MTTHVVSLFLPYTVDFHESKSNSNSSPASSPQPAPTQLADAGRQPSSATSIPSVRSGSKNEEQPQSLLKQAPPSHIQLPKTPMRMTEHEDFFTPGQPSAATHFPKPADPRGLVRSDAHVPEWGASGLFFNQPISRAEPAPPDTILEYAKAQERAQAQKERMKGSHAGKPTTDPRWATEYSVVPAVQGNGGLTNAVRAAVDNKCIGDIIFVGLIGFPTDSLNEDKKAEIYDKLEEEHDALTVFVSDKDFDGHYAHYCKTILWPVFHYIIPDHPKSKAFLDHSWVFYVKVNQAFADKVVKNYKRGDVIWIHDYHLCLVPQMIRQKLPDAQIGFFLHTAFPSSEVFRCLAARKELLDGMLGANLVAFQTPEYAHHFLQTCSRILSVEATEDGVQLESRFVNVWSSPIGIDPRALALAREEPQVLEWITTMQKRYEGKKVIVARDKLDNIRGVRQKLLAFELFLNKNPEWKDKVVMIQVATSTTEDTELAATVSEIVTRIDAVHSTLTHNPLIFLRQDIAFSQYLALLSIADALAITSLREGMNLTCHEFVICQDGRASEKKHSPVILSEFTGSASIFDGADLSVNPWDYNNIAEAFRVALEMSDVEKERRYTKLRNMVMHQTGDFWVNNLSNHLSKVHAEQFKRDTMSIPRLSSTNLSRSYQQSQRRLFVLDYEGTLASYGSVNNTILANTERVIVVLNDLVAEEKNVVYVMTGRTVRETELIFNRVRGLGLIAENGCFLREPNTNEWIQFPEEEKTVKWKDSVKPILQYYLERVEGSWVEERHCSIIFHYNKSNDKDDSSSRHAGDCANHINDACEQQRVKAIPTKDSVVIEPVDFDKAFASQHILNKYPEEARPDFLFVAGNDRSDEAVFHWAKKLKDESIIPNVETVTVGDRNSIAMSTLPNGTTGLLGALSKLAKAQRSSP
ncbi:Glycosyltransferase family 20 protein [Pyrenophora tritici-repentis]|uniref:Glycosyltransferase family 20 protein n=1 Tax=Pyrenophora tritici-repentis TaxID=45151 RepID=A0A2W1ETR8_9PLEO|nr:Glycosyltransferase family 20 protein [Pyrenophora tritici-repentis]KAF7452047.1 Glycosyltransferase family 20 protein [Pyrenophora tritici-repentis]KAF7574836.1 glycosyltransferase family 20 protein [Pyrenophora tritici-repentis]KAG9386399.1 Glycosyltransferase family 20 protein [Pyrenophora tritici-repentis]KAI0587154.1 Glycosyltransferase family 20 protein [Pyrenophora tritici-repentis]